MDMSLYSVSESREKIIQSSIGQRSPVEVSQELNLMFRDTVTRIETLFRNYSVKDVANSLFVSSLWLPNISSLVAHQFFTAIFLSLKETDFQVEDHIYSYTEFQDFLEKLYYLACPFPIVQDYFPEADWGEVKFFHEGKRYALFYGNELDTVYDFLNATKLVHLCLEDEYRERLKLDLNNELLLCLFLQDEIISHINTQPNLFEYAQEIEIGSLHIPSQHFWEESLHYLASQDILKSFQPELVDNLALELDSINIHQLTYEEFGQKILQGNFMLGFFLKSQNAYTPLLPRRCTAVLIDRWGGLYEKIHSTISEDIGERLRQQVGYRLFLYTRNILRLSSQGQLFHHAVAMTEKNRDHKTAFSLAILYKNHLYLFYILQPLTDSKKDLKKLLNQTLPSLNAARKLILKNRRLFFPLDFRGFEIAKEAGPIDVQLFLVLPRLTFTIPTLKLPQAFQGRVIHLQQLLGLFDDLEDIKEFENFLTFLKENDSKISSIYIDYLDKWVAFKDTDGVLVEGVETHSRYMTNPHWGSNIRFETLATFWRDFPPIPFRTHPRTWLVDKTRTHTRVFRRTAFPPKWLYYAEIGKTHLYIISPSQDLSFEQLQITNQMMEMLADSIHMNATLLNQHNPFGKIENLHIYFYPYSLVLADEQLAQFRSCTFNEQCFKITSSVHRGIPQVHVVMEDEKAFEIFTAVKDRSFEITFLTELIVTIGGINPGQNVSTLLQELDNLKAMPPRYKMFQYSKLADFPQLVSTVEPETYHLKMARKLIAHCASGLDFKEGIYESSEAKIHLNKLKEKLIEHFNSLVNEYNFLECLPYILTRLGAVTHEYELESRRVKSSLHQEVDYVRGDSHAESTAKFTELHNEYRYVLEKFIQLSPSGTKGMTAQDFQQMAAHAHWLLTIYKVSDQLHYGLYPSKMRIRQDYVMDVIPDEETHLKDKAFGKLMAQISIGEIGNASDRVSSPTPLQDLTTQVNTAFKQDLGFTFTTMIQALAVLSHWASYNQDVAEDTVYSSPIEKVIDVCVSVVDSSTPDELRAILTFLTLRSDDVDRVLDESGNPMVGKQPDIPVWEHNKRYARYTLKPIVCIENTLYWEPYGPYKAGIIWSSTIAENGTLPVNMKRPNIDRVLRSHKESIEKAVVKKAFEIVKRFTNYAEAEIYLHKKDKSYGHLLDLGDYDVLAYIKDKNILLNIECKDLLPPFCMKDSKNQQNRVLGKEDKPDDFGYAGKVERRQTYLLDHMSRIKELFTAPPFSWPFDTSNAPRVISLFVSRQLTLWSQYPTREVAITFLQIDTLEHYLQSLSL